jgi:uncharacterized protein (DUF433 family)
VAVLDPVLLDRITTDPRILGGKPIVRGTRVSVELVPDHLAHGMSFASMRDVFPHPIEDDIRACLEYAAVVMASSQTDGDSRAARRERPAS